MQPDLENLYYKMVLIRLFEETLASLWHRGLIAGELHLGIGEEALVAGFVSHLQEGDGLALDHRSTPPLVARGVDLKAIVLELLGSEEGLCRGRGGHMHLFDRGLLAASSGIVGASGPTACGFALAAQHLRPGGVAVAYFGEGAMNQGMLLESLNLAVVWKLPVIFVCRDNRWAITTRSRTVTGGNLATRAKAFGMPAVRVNGLKVEKVWKMAGSAVERARKGLGPTFLLARCPRLTGHFLGDPLLRVFKEPVEQARDISGPLIRAALSSPGGSPSSRIAGLGKISQAISTMALERYVMRQDPLKVARKRLPEDIRYKCEEEAGLEVERVVGEALKIAESDLVG